MAEEKKNLSAADAILAETADLYEDEIDAVAEEVVADVREEEKKAAGKVSGDTVKEEDTPAFVPAPKEKASDKASGAAAATVSEAASAATAVTAAATATAAEVTSAAQAPAAAPAPSQPAKEEKASDTTVESKKQDTPAAASAKPAAPGASAHKTSEADAGKSAGTPKKAAPLKQSLIIPTLQTMIPPDLTEEELRAVYCAYVERHRIAGVYFIRQIRDTSARILDHEQVPEFAAENTSDLIYTVAVASGIARLLAEKLLLLEGKTLENGGSIEPREPALGRREN